MKINPIIIALLVITYSCNKSSSDYSEKDLDSLEIKLGKKISIATDTEIEKALLSPEMNNVRTNIAKSIYYEKQAMIDSVINKYNMHKKDEAIKVYNELQEKGINWLFLRDIVHEFHHQKQK